MNPKRINLLRSTGLGRITTGEYRANRDGLNMFFGAVLGLVLAGTEGLANWRFGVVLLCLASVVITIHYISSSRWWVQYALLALVYSIGFPRFMDVLLGGSDLVPDKIRPTLVVWTLMAILVEFWNRDPDPDAGDGSASSTPLAVPSQAAGSGATLPGEASRE